MYCKNCGSEITSEQNFCENCGTPQALSPIPQAPELSTEVAEENAWPVKRILKYVFLTLVLFVAALGWVVLMADDLYTDITPENSALQTEINAVLTTSNDEAIISGEGLEFTTTLIEQMSERIKPIGYFTNPEFFTDTTLSRAEWFSYLAYFDLEESTPSLIQTRQQFPNQNNILSAVVKIVCEDAEYYYYGSGTNISKEGYVLTNLHVIEPVLANPSCIVGFPDPRTGLIKEMYWATPIVDDEDETGHDLAILSIEEPVFDDEYQMYGFYKSDTEGFPYFTITEECRTKPVQLGDDIFVLGYPPLSGGSLTITSGLISSLYSQDGYLVTSAKIASGNSGGLAVDREGCRVGVPTAVYYEAESESFGEIIDSEFLEAFFAAIVDDVDDYLSNR